MKKIGSITFSCLLILVFVPGFSQTSVIDSLSNLLKSQNSPATQAALLNQLSFELRTKDFSKSKDYANQARDIATRNNLKSEVARSYVNTGTAYYFIGEHQHAASDYMKALSMFEELGDKGGQIYVLNEFGTLEKKNGHLEGSETHLLRALELSREIADSTRVANSMNNLGHCYEMKGNIDLAMKLYEESTAIKEKQKDWFAASFNYDNMANILARQGKFDAAEAYYQREIKIFKDLNDQSSYAIAINNLGEMYLLKGENKRSREYFEKSLKISQQVGFNDLTQHIYTMLSNSYEREQDYRRAFQYYKQSTALKDSIFNEQKSRQLVDIQTKYETEKKESQIKLLRQENEIKDFGLRQNRLFILGLTLALLAILIVGFLWFNRMKLKQSVELEMTRASLRESQLQAVIKSQEEERRRFAADLHDGLGQIISALRLNLSREKLEEKAIDQALNLLNEMNGEIRNIAFNLMPHALMNEGLESALIQFGDRINRTDKVQVKVSAFNLSKEIPSDQKIALYRICQEWVNNVIKYSGATMISLQLVQHPDELVVTIEDDGNGFDTSVLQKSTGNGWKNINSRASLIKGSVEIDSVSGRKGTTLLLSVPSYTLVV